MGRVVLTGSILRAQDRVRVTPKLIRVADDAQLWATVYDEEMAGLFGVQSRIAEQVVTALGVALRAADRQTLAATPTKNLEAYHYFLRGLQYGQRGQLKVEILNATEMLGRAVQLDSNFAQAWARLSAAHAGLYWYNFDPTPQRLAVAKAAAEAEEAPEGESPAEESAEGEGE